MTELMNEWWMPVHKWIPGRIGTGRALSMPALREERSEIFVCSFAQQVLTGLLPTRQNWSSITRE